MKPTAVGVLLAKSDDTAWDWQTIEHLIAQRAAHLRQVLHSETAAARSALFALLAEPMKFEPVSHREYEVSGLTRAGMLLETTSEKGHKVAVPRGFTLLASNALLPIWLRRAA